MLNMGLALFRQSSVQTRAWIVCSSLCVIIFALAAQAFADSPDPDRNISDPKARARIALMTDQKVALNVLGDMMAGRILFDAARARDARQSLIRNTGDIPAAFRKRSYDPDAHAAETVWSDWSGFRAEARAARRTARGLKVRNLQSLRRTLPPMVRSCISCHQRYRDAPTDVITH